MSRYPRSVELAEAGPVMPLFADLAPKFDSGIPLSEADHVALGEQLIRVRDVLADGEVHTVAEIAQRLQIPENSASAQCRNLRKPKHGGYRVIRVPLGGRRYAYQMVR